MKNSYSCTIEDMTCSGCVKRITQAILKHDNQAEIQTHLDSKVVEVKTNLADFAVLAHALEQIGYSTKNITNHN